ncbi:hypothetical protein CTI12_AA130380 [Artemisia annua]|uniref:Uncharacterized protein n=1 Tax=Artemisia annua TaxID=35608 RepID=A0A2U1PNY2_ARTAN|nr:hypothetical protein CTI12_AA130380 [Artemisia annua]
MGSKVQFKPKKQVYQAVSKKNGASSSGMKKNYEVPSHVTNSTNPFDALNMIENDDELGSNGGSSNSIFSLEAVSRSTQMLDRRLPSKLRQKNLNPQHGLFGDTTTRFPESKLDESQK